MEENHRRMQFERATKDLLSNCQLLPMTESEYQTHSYTDTHTWNVIDHEGRQRQFVVTQDAWMRYLAETDKVFYGRVKSSTVQSSIIGMLRELVSSPYSIPFAEDTIEIHTEVAYASLNIESRFRAVALVPLYNVSCHLTSSLELPLARALFYSGYPNSRLAKHVALEPVVRESFGDIAEYSFLEIQVSGDADCRHAQVQWETAQALKVLRFVSGWYYNVSDTRLTLTSPALYVSEWGSDALFYLVHQPGRKRLHSSTFSGTPPLTINESYAKDARNMYGLDDLNFHFQREDNPISCQIVRALTFYDNGVKAREKWEAICQYVLCINVAVLTGHSGSEKLRKDVRSLIQFGKTFLGTEVTPFDQAHPLNKTWDALACARVQPFEDFYRIRSTVVHGGEMNFAEITDEVLKEAQELAHNAVRIVARLARQNAWEDYQTVKRWFEVKRRT